MSEDKSRTSSRTRRRGFSLLELVMVVAIISIAAAVAVPRFGKAAARYHIDMAARRIVQDLALASRQARNAGAARTATFDANGTRYTVSHLAGMERASDAYRVNLLAEPYCSQAESVDFGGDRTVIFNAFGLPDSGGQIVLKAGDSTRTISLDAASGKATVE